MSDFAWEKNIRKVVPYTPGEQPESDNIIKLNTNENPYGPSEKLAALIDKLDIDSFRKYPDPAAKPLVNALAAFHNVSPEKVFVGVGSDDVLAMSFMTFFNSDKEILFPDITYSFYPVWADMLRIPYKQIPLEEDFTIDTEKYYSRCGGVVIPNPNAPTAMLLDKQKITDIIERCSDAIVIIDEAYIDFSPEGSSVIDLIDKYDNLLVVRTFSKSRSLAGLRIGYAVGNEKLIKYLNDVKYSYNSYTMNYPSIILGSAVIDDNDYFLETIEKIKKTRDEFTVKLTELGFTVLPSDANFVFASHKDVPAKEIFEYARNNGVYFRYFNMPRIDNYLRITIGKDEDMCKVFELLSDFLTRR